MTVKSSLSSVLCVCYLVKFLQYLIIQDTLIYPEKLSNLPQVKSGPRAHALNHCTILCYLKITMAATIYSLLTFIRHYVSQMTSEGQEPIT